MFDKSMIRNIAAKMLKWNHWNHHWNRWFGFFHQKWRFLRNASYSTHSRFHPFPIYSMVFFAHVLQEHHVEYHQVDNKQVWIQSQVLFIGNRRFFLWERTGFGMGRATGNSRTCSHPFPLIWCHFLKCFTRAWYGKLARRDLVSFNRKWSIIHVKSSVSDRLRQWRSGGNNGVSWQFTRSFPPPASPHFVFIQMCPIELNIFKCCTRAWYEILPRTRPADSNSSLKSQREKERKRDARIRKK